MAAKPEFRGSFEIVGSNLVDGGVRLSLTNRMIRIGVQWGSVENIGTKKLVVKLGGTKEEIIKHRKTIVNNFEKWLNEDIGERERLVKKIANPKIRFTKLVFDNDMFILPMNMHSHGLQCDQLRKGVDVYYELKEAMHDLRDINAQLLKELASRHGC
jgi:hypothetical protein